MNNWPYLHILKSKGEEKNLNNNFNIHPNIIIFMSCTYCKIEHFTKLIVHFVNFCTICGQKHWVKCSAHFSKCTENF
jgi:hypothetical protein